MIMDATKMLLDHKIVAIFRGIADAQADSAAEALVRGGIMLMEVTMNTEGALPIISRWRKKFDGQALIGAGTVLDVAMAKQAIDAGAQFLISPNLDELVLQYASDRGVDVWPGVMTPTEIVRAWKAGAKAIKLFPMGSLGTSYLREIRAPLHHIPILATGGVDLHNISEYFLAGANAVGLGTKLVRPDLIASGDYAQLEEVARQFATAVCS